MQLHHKVDKIVNSVAVIAPGSLEYVLMCPQIKSFHKLNLTHAGSTTTDPVPNHRASVLCFAPHAASVVSPMATDHSSIDSQYTNKLISSLSLLLVA